MNFHTQCFNHGAQHFAAAVIDLHGHQAWRELHNVGFQPQVPECLGCFQAQQSAADDNSHLAVGGVGFNGFQIFDGAVYQTLRTVLAGNWRHKRIGAGGEHQFVIRHLVSVCRDDLLVGAVNFHGLVIQPDVDVVVGKKTFRYQRQILCAFPGEIGRQVHAIICRTWFFAESGDIKGSCLLMRG